MGKQTSRTKRGEFRKREQRDAVAFLKERNLLSTFNRFKRIRSIKKKSIMVSQDGISQRLVIHKRNNKVIVRDAFSLRVVATTKRFNMNNVEKAFLRKKEVSVKLNDKSGTRIVNELKLKELTRVPLTNVVQIDRMSPLMRKVGKLFINITFIAKNKDKITLEGGSRELRLLNSEGQRKIAFDQAFKGALSQVPFSYETFIINWIHYSYFLEKKKPQPIFQYKEVLRAV